MDDAKDKTAATISLDMDDLRIAVARWIFEELGVNVNHEAVTFTFDGYDNDLSGATVELSRDQVKQHIGLRDRQNQEPK